MPNAQTTTDTAVSPKTLLIITAGTTDLQLLAGMDGKAVRIPLPSRAWHEHFLINPSRYQICPLDNLPSAIALPEFTSRSKVKLDSSDVWTLIPAKLGMAMTKLTFDGSPPDKVIVFNTNREAEETEPVGVGPIVCRWLEQLWGSRNANCLPFSQFAGSIDKPWQNSTRCSYIDVLSGKENAEERDGRMLEERVFDALTTASAEGFSRILTADTGGMPQIKRVLELTARLIWGDACMESLRLADTRPRGERKPQANEFAVWSDLTKLIPGTPRPIDAGVTEWSPAYLQARILAKTLITQLNFPAAHAVAQTTPALVAVVGRTQDTAWREAAKGAAAVVGGLMRNNIDNEKASWWPQKTLVPRTKSPVTISQTLICAIRVECALQNGNWATAMTQTCELFEWALFESVKRLGSENNSDKLFKSVEVENVMRRIDQALFTKLAIPQIAGDNRPPLYKWCAIGHLDAPLFLEKSTNSWDFRNGKSSETQNYGEDRTAGPAKIWAKLLDKQAADISPLTDLYNAINLKRHDGDSLAYFRNFQTHQGLATNPTGAMSVQKACAAFVREELWPIAFETFPTDANDLTTLTPGFAFMAQPKIKAVLRSVCGIAEPAAEFATWVKRLEADMAEP